MEGVSGTRNSRWWGATSQCQFTKGTFCLMPTARGKDWLRGRGDTIGTIHLDSSKTFTSMSHSSLTAWGCKLQSQELRVHWAQNSQCFELNCQVVTSDSPQSPEPGQNILNILLNRREPSQGHWFVQPGEGKAQRRPNYSFLLEQGLWRRQSQTLLRHAVKGQETTTASCNQGVGHEEQMLGHGSS